MHCAEQVAQLASCFCAAPEVAKLARAIQGGGVPDDVIVDMPLIYVGGYHEGVLPLREARCELIANLVRLLRRYFPGLEGLTNLIINHITLLRSAGDFLVLPLG